MQDGPKAGFENDLLVSGESTVQKKLGNQSTEKVGKSPAQLEGRIRDRKMEEAKSDMGKRDTHI
jgi:hypothetical protein